MLNLITDRTAADVANGTSKGSYSDVDLNRVQEANKYLCDLLNSLGYIAVYNPILVSSGIPSEYTPVEYIYNDTGAYIDTGYKPTGSTRVVCDIEVLLLDSALRCLFGTRDTISATSPNQFCLWKTTSTNSMRTDYFGQNETISVDLSQRIIVDKNAQDTYINGELKSSLSFSSGKCSFSIPIWGYKSGSESVNTSGSCKIYSFQIYENDVLVMDFIPVKNASGEFGLYDKKGKNFYGNGSNSGAIYGGPDIQESEPERYSWIEKDIPTEAQMQEYLSNVRRLCDVLRTQHSIPESMTKLTYSGANDIEKALLAVEDAIRRMELAFIPCGEAICGGDNL